VFGADQVVTIFVIASAARHASLPASGVSTLLRRLLPLAARALVALFVSGVIMDVRAGRAYDGSDWFRMSILLLIGLGVLVGLSTRALSKQAANDVGDASRFSESSVSRWKCWCSWEWPTS
jgi:hypothetical protein